MGHRRRVVGQTAQGRHVGAKMSREGSGPGVSGEEAKKKINNSFVCFSRLGDKND